MWYAFTKTRTPNSCALHREQQSVMLFLNKFRINTFARVVSLKTQNERREVRCRLFIVHRQNTVTEQSVFCFVLILTSGSSLLRCHIALRYRQHSIGFRY